MKRTILAAILACMIATTLHAAQSVIAEGEGYACMGDDKSRKVTESAAAADVQAKCRGVCRYPHKVRDLR